MRALRLAWAIYMLKRAGRKRKAACRATDAAERAVEAVMPYIGVGSGSKAFPPQS